ncbi:hypothetical protein [Leptospira levettii]|uniref:hypothetical protein n=1 Tax=Leptospira levettii TaxID=2023178 RepID=UPI000C29ED65|nr:hypothetical protein [Leptospira levettii]PJZ87352.1 hypothetical protein CH368_17305 [Leptospira levettii]
MEENNVSLVVRKCILCKNTKEIRSFTILPYFNDYCDVCNSCGKVDLKNYRRYLERQEQAESPEAEVWSFLDYLKKKKTLGGHQGRINSMREKAIERTIAFLGEKESKKKKTCLLCKITKPVSLFKLNKAKRGKPPRLVGYVDKLCLDCSNKVAVEKRAKKVMKKAS